MNSCSAVGDIMMIKEGRFSFLRNSLKKVTTPQIDNYSQFLKIKTDFPFIDFYFDLFTPACNSIMD